MTLNERILNDLKDAMKTKNTQKLSVIRLIQGAIKNEQIAKQKELTEAEIISIIAKQAKQRRDSITSYEKGNRPDLVQKEQDELKIISEYLPEEMSDDALKKIISSAITKLNAQNISDMGKVMGKIMPEIQGKADGSKVSQMVRDLLSK